MDDTQQAFAHPEDRSIATAPLRDRISVRDMVVTVEIGAFQAERGTTQRVRFNVVVELGDPFDAADDDVDKILSYDRVTEAIEGELSADRLALLETLAERIADRILIEPMAARVFVRIEKLDRGAGVLGVEIVRERSGATLTLDDAPQPVVVHLTNDLIAGDGLTAWINAAEAHGQPVVFCVPLPDAYVSGLNALAQRRVDLLAYEQNAWALAAKDARCVVVGTRTELDWGMRNDQIMVWAPSKLVLDSVDCPVGDVRDTAALVDWFAVEVAASQVKYAAANDPVKL